MYEMIVKMKKVFGFSVAMSKNTFRATLYKNAVKFSIFLFAE